MLRVFHIKRLGDVIPLISYGCQKNMIISRINHGFSLKDEKDNTYLVRAKSATSEHCIDDALNIFGISSFPSILSLR